MTVVGSPSTRLPSSIAIGVQRARWTLRNPLMQAAMALVIAGVGRVLFNSVLGFHFGSAGFASYAALAGASLLIGSLAAAGPTAAVTIGVAREWHGQGELTYHTLWKLAVITIVLGGCVIGLALPFTVVEGGHSSLVIASAVAIAVYQVLRAFGYAVKRAALVTRLELIGAIGPLLTIGFYQLSPSHLTVPRALGAYLVGPISFCLLFLVAMSRRVRVTRGIVPDATTGMLWRVAVVFLVGAGSATALQYVPTLLSATRANPGITAVLFGAVQATAPLLLFSRIYATIEMPRIAGGGTPSRLDPNSVLSALFLPSLAVALGVAPWVALSLGVSLTPTIVSTAAMVSLSTLLQVWSTPAVTQLSADGREAIPAAASLGGLLVASSIWWLGAGLRVGALYPIGLALGAVVRSGVPAWIAAGRNFGARNPQTIRRAAGALAVAVSLAVASLAGSATVLVGGAVLCALGVAGVAAILRRRTTGNDAHPAR